jgi:hypothetical protein
MAIAGNTVISNRGNSHDLPIRCSDRTARMFMSIVENRIISNRNHGSDLPASWRTLYQLSRVDDRAELSVGERADQIAEWIRLTAGVQEPAQLGQVSRGGRGNTGGINAAARQLPGVTRQEAQRAVRIAGIEPEAREAARDAGLDDNQSALLRIAAAHRARRQIASHSRALRPVEQPAKGMSHAVAESRWRGSAAVLARSRYFCGRSEIFVAGH